MELFADWVTHFVFPVACAEWLWDRVWRIWCGALVWCVKCGGLCEVGGCCGGKADFQLLGTWLYRGCLIAYGGLFCELWGELAVKSGHFFDDFRFGVDYIVENDRFVMWCG